MKKVLWGWIILTMVVSIPFLLERIKVENENNTYEVSMPYSDVQAMQESGIPTKQILKKLRKAKVESLSFVPLTLADIHNKGLIQKLPRSELLQRFEVDSDMLPSEKGIWIEVLEPQHALVKVIPEAINSNYKNVIQVKRYHFGRSEFLFVPYGTKFTLNQPISFDMDTIHEAVTYGFSIIPRLKNDFNDENEKHPLFRQIGEMKSHVHHLAFIGEEVVGYSDDGNLDRIQRMAERMKIWDANVVMIENMNQRGFQDLVRYSENKLVRLHSLILGKENKQEAINVYRSVRAVKERNIQILYVNVIQKNPLEIYHTPVEAQGSLIDAVNFVNKLHSEIPEKTGVAEPFNPFSQPQWIKAFILIAAAAFIGVVMGNFQKQFMLPFLIFGIITGCIEYFLNTSVITKLLVLFIAVIAPVYATHIIMKHDPSNHVSLSFLKALGVTLMGAWFVTSMLYGWEFLVHVDSFRGVKLLSILPVIVVCLMLTGLTWLNNTVRYWNVFLFVLLLGVVMFYLGRTGNQGAAIPFELSFRQFLENLFGVRPRTKEFMMGIPMLTFGIYLVNKGYHWGKYLFVFGAMAFSSIIGTFTHLHTPLIISFYRTGLSLVLGLAIGLLMILAWELLNKNFISNTKERFSTWKL